MGLLTDKFNAVRDLNYAEANVLLSKIQRAINRIWQCRNLFCEIDIEEGIVLLSDSELTEKVDWVEADLSNIQSSLEDNAKVLEDHIKLLKGEALRDGAFTME